MSPASTLIAGWSLYAIRTSAESGSPWLPRRVGHGALQEIDPAVADLGESADVGAQAVDGGVVHLVVARVHDAAARGLEHDRDRVGDRVRDPDELRAERPELNRLAVGICFLELRGAQQAVLVELRLDQPEREPRRPDLLHARLAEEVRKRADVILVTVRQQHGTDRLVQVGQIREVGQDQVDSEVLVAREREARIDDDRLPVGFEDGCVLAHLAQAAERDDSGASWHRRSVVARRR